MSIFGFSREFFLFLLFSSISGPPHFHTTVTSTFHLNTSLPHKGHSLVAPKIRHFSTSLQHKFVISTRHFNTNSSLWHVTSLQVCWWRSLRAEKKWPLCGIGVLKCRVCGSKRYSPTGHLEFQKLPRLEMVGKIIFYDIFEIFNPTRVYIWGLKIRNEFFSYPQIFFLRLNTMSH